MYYDRKEKPMVKKKRSSGTISYCSRHGPGLSYDTSYYCMVSFTQNNSMVPPQIQVVIIAVASFAYLLLGRCTQSKPPDATFYHHHGHLRIMDAER